ncbi:MAG: OstA-like protein, partial [Saprospiraceae bacterium]
IDIDFAERLDVVQRGKDQEQRLVGNVELSQDSIYMYCDSAVLVNSVQLRAFGDITFQQGDTLAAFSKRLVYNADKKEADLYENVLLQNGEQLLYTDALHYNLVTKVATYSTGGRLTDRETELTSRRATYYAGTNVIVFRDSVTVIDKRFEMRADSLRYDARAERVTFLGPTVIRTDSSRIYCEDGFYDVRNNVAEFRQNAQYGSGERQATADVIRYEGKATGSVYTLDGDARFKEGERRQATADQIRYDAAADAYELKGDAYFRDSLRTIRGEEIVYDAKQDRYATRGGRSYISDPPNLLEADTVDYDKVAGFGLARGNVIWRDTSARITIEAGRADYRQEDGYLKASGGRGNRALMITELDGDSLFVTADTLFSTQDITFTPIAAPPVDTAAQQNYPAAIDSLSVTDTLYSTTSPPAPHRPDTTAITTAPDLTAPPGRPDTTLAAPTALTAASAPLGRSDTTRRVLAYRDVRIYKSDMQGLADSLSFNSRDSILTLYREPIMWQDTAQFTADTIDVHLRNSRLDHVHLKRTAFVATSTDLLFFNQVKGKDIFAYFDSSTLKRTEVEGNAESIYYAQDKVGAYIGVNQIACSEMVLDFDQNAIKDIRFLQMPSGKMDPISRVRPATQPELPGFLWLRDLRPTGLPALFGPPLRQLGQRPVASDDKPGRNSSRPPSPTYRPGEGEPPPGRGRPAGREKE